MSTKLDRQRGTLLGLAVGDALGAAVEFESPGTFPPVTGYRGDGPHNIEAGAWTDDTSLALAMADSMGTVGWELNDQASRYVRWFRHGDYSVNGRCFDIGMTTGLALERFEQSGNARTCGDDHPRASGNGSIMRSPPVPIHFAALFPDRVNQLAHYAEESSLTTHASPQCRSACRYLATVLAALINGIDRDEVLSPNWPPLETLQQESPLHSEVEAVANGTFRHKQPPEIFGSGYVVKSLEAALWAFHQAKDFREAVLAAVNLGDDSDTTGAVCGQLAGAYWGETGIPDEWLAGLVKREMIEEALQKVIGAKQQPELDGESIHARMHEEWCALDEAMCTSFEILDGSLPWHSTHPDVVKAWEALTRPEHLTDLENRLALYDNGVGMNDWAEAVTRKAISVARERAGQ